jgi:hypothetical protein
MKNHVKKWEHSKDLFFGGKGKQLGFFFQILFIYLFSLNKLEKISKILAHLVDFTQRKVESFQEKSNFFVSKGQNLWERKKTIGSNQGKCITAPK